MKTRRNILTVVTMIAAIGLAGGTAGAGLIAHYPLDTITAGTTPDSTGGTAGTLNGGGISLAGSGVIGDSLDFASSGNHVAIPNHPWGTTAFTASVWFNPDSLGNQGPLADWTNGGSSPQTFLIRTSGSTLQTHVRSSANVQKGGSVSFPSETLTTSGFNHVVLAYDGQRARTYLNGELSTTVHDFGSASTIGNGSAAGDASIGKSGGGSERELVGLADDVAFWDETLTDGKVAAIFNLADEPALNYDASQADQLFQVFDGALGDVEIGGLTWRQDAGQGGAPGDVVDLGNGDFFLNLDGDAGVSTLPAGPEPHVIPEPATMLAVFAGLAGLGGYVKRRKGTFLRRIEMKTTRKMLTVVMLMAAIALAALSASNAEAAVLFGDTFDRPDSSDLNASTAGKSGTLGALDYVVKTHGNCSASIDNNQLKLRENGGGGGGAIIAYLDHNFVDADIAAAGGFSATIDLIDYATAGSGRWKAVVVGQSLAEVNGFSQNTPSATQDLFVGYRWTQKQLEVYKSGGYPTPFSEDDVSSYPLPQTMKIDYSFSDFNAGSTVGYEVFLGADSITSGTFTWSGTEENYISIFSNIASDLSHFDNLEITADISTGPAPVPIAGVDFEGASQSDFDRNPDDLDPADGIGVSSGTGGTMFDGWTLIRKSDNASFSGLLRNDNGARNAGATTPDFPARLEGNSTGSWSITIPDDVELDLDRIEFDVRAATGGSGRDGMFNTSLDGSNLLWENYNLPGRNAGWLHVGVDLSGDLYQNLTDQTVSFIWNTNTSGAIDLDTIQVFGTAGPLGEIPEPATMLAVFAGLAGLGGYVRKRHLRFTIDD